SPLWPINAGASTRTWNLRVTRGWPLLMVPIAGYGSNPRVLETSSLAVVDGAAPLTVNLAEVDRGAVALVGGKGANLGDMARAGFPVPNGFVLTTHAYALAAEAAGIDPARPYEAAERLRSAPGPTPS